MRETLTPTMEIHLTVNGRAVHASIEPRELLLDFLRDQLGLKGAKRSCDVQVCGACTVLLDGLPVSACCTLAYEARNCTVTTIERLAQDGQLHSLQEAFLTTSAVQCGFCTAGMVLTVKHLLEKHPHPTLDQIKHHLDGSLCRCTGYWNILDAVQEAAQKLSFEGAIQRPPVGAG